MLPTQHTVRMEPLFLIKLIVSSLSPQVKNKGKKALSNRENFLEEIFLLMNQSTINQFRSTFHATVGKIETLKQSTIYVQ